MMVSVSILRSGLENRGSRTHLPGITNFINYRDFFAEKKKRRITLRLECNRERLEPVPFPQQNIM